MHAANAVTPTVTDIIAVACFATKWVTLCQPQLNQLEHPFELLELELELLELELLESLELSLLDEVPLPVLGPHPLPGAHGP